jgi:hypothetical protein
MVESRDQELGIGDLQKTQAGCGKIGISRIRLCF